MEPNEQPAVIPQIDAQDIALAEQVRNIYRAEVGAGITRKDIVNPAFWAHYATKFRPYDEVTIIRQDGTLFARAVVLQAERTWARMFVLEWHDLTTRDVSMSQATPAQNNAAAEDTTGAGPTDPSKTFTLMYKGQRMKWCVIRQSDGMVVHEGEADKRAAEAWLTDYIKVIA